MIIAVLGPTASGKTGLSIELAQEFKGEIISADSVAVYKGFDIGSAKPTEEERQKAIFHLVDCTDYTQNYSVGDFQRDAHLICDDILKRGRLPIISGGSGLYAKAALEGLDNVPQTTPQIREKVNSLIENDFEKSVELLKKADPKICETADLKNPRRVGRLLEIYEMTGKAPSEVYNECRCAKRPDYTAFCLTMERDRLIERINRRVDLMVEMGLFEETENLLNTGVPKDCQPMGSIGYKECVAYFDGILSKDEAIERIKISTRQFAKRQYTWFRKYSNVIWTDIKDIKTINNYIKRNIK